MQQQTHTFPQWLQQKKIHAEKLLLHFPQQTRDKQEIGMLALDTFSVAEQQKNDSKQKVELLSTPKEIVCFFSQDENSSSHPTLFQTTGTVLSPEESSYHAFHYVHLQNILFVQIPKETIVSTPLHLRKILSGNSAIHHVVVIAEPLSSITILDEEYSRTSTTPGYVSSFVEIIVQDGAEVTYVSLQNYNQHLQHHIQRKATVAKDGKMNWVEAYFGSMYTKSTVSAVLEADGAASTNTTVFFGDGKQKFDIMSRTIQVGKHTFADMNTIGVVSDAARSMCRGLIKIAPQSFGSSGHQKIKTLLMSKESQANAIPSMQIDNFDVRATHESSVGQISKDKLFYLMSRGLSEQEARIKIVQGYFTQLTKCIHNHFIVAEIQRLIHEKLKLPETAEEIDNFDMMENSGDVHA